MSNFKDLECINEDTVECYLFSSSLNQNATYWTTLCEDVNKSIETLSQGYIWHKDEFKVHLPIMEKNKDIPPHLLSTTSFGDNIEDEWFIVYLIFEITKLHLDIIIQIKDSDGEFLLIEAADYLPPWANPDNTDNRVFIYQNHVHIIPPTLADLDMELSVEDAIKIVAKSPEKTKTFQVQMAIKQRLSNYPEKINENMHKAIAKLPLDLATLLTIKPSLIAPIVTTYCNHDIIDAKACIDISFDENVILPVKFTRCLYAMLLHSKQVKTLKKMFLKESDKKSTLGLKITCGYHIIMKQKSKDIFSTNNFKSFTKSLKDNGYFRNYIEGSADYNKLMEKAKEYFVNIECPVSSYVCQNISEIMNTREYNEMKNSLKDKYDPNIKLRGDNEDWLSLHPEQLNDFLNEHYGKPSKFKNDDVVTSQALTSELSSFLKQNSDYEGIEVDKPEDNKIDFDSEEFISSLKNMMNFIQSGDVNDLDSDNSEDSEDAKVESELDKELKSKLELENSSGDSNKIYQNMIQSLKEEGALSGPSSNILKSIGVAKTDLLDSDDDEEHEDKYFCNYSEL